MLNSIFSRNKKQCIKLLLFIIFIIFIVQINKRNKVKQFFQNEKYNEEDIELRKYIAKVSSKFKENSSCKSNWVIVINWSKYVIETAKQMHNWCFLIVIRNSLKQIENKNIFYLTQRMQNDLSKRSEFIRINLQSKSIDSSLKNIGYLWSILNGAKVVFDFDNKNQLIFNKLFIDQLLFNETINVLTIPNYNHKLFNPFEFFIPNSKVLWPKYFSKISLENRFEHLYGIWSMENIGIIHSLSEFDLNQNSFIEMKKTFFSSFQSSKSKDKILIVPRRIFSYYTDQSTLHFEQSLWALVLPIHIHQALSPIYRSLIMQRLMWDAGLQIAFCQPLFRKSKFHYDQSDINDGFQRKIDTLIVFLNQWASNKTNFVDHIEQLFADLYQKMFIEFNDFHLISLWLKQLKEIQYKFPSKISKYTLAVRTFSGHIDRINRWLIPTVNMFVDRNLFDFLIILDDESTLDHRFGQCLISSNYSVRYERLPWFSKKIHFRGYDRQQWSTFYMDKYSKSDFIGVVDADSMIYSFVHPIFSIFSSDNDQRIMLKAMVGDHYIYDKLALKFDLNLDFMWPNRMPMWYRWETFQHVRNYISSAWNGIHFDNAFIEFSKNQGYSQFTIMSSYSIKFESNFYTLILSNDTNGAISVSCNHGQDKRAREFDIRIGCCRTFHIGCNHSSKPDLNVDHLYRYDYSNLDVFNLTEKTNMYYEYVHQYLKQIHPNILLNMTKSCFNYLNNLSTPVCDN